MKLNLKIVLTIVALIVFSTAQKASALDGITQLKIRVTVLKDTVIPGGRVVRGYPGVGILAISGSNLDCGWMNESLIDKTLTAGTTIHLIGDVTEAYQSYDALGDNFQELNLFRSLEPEGPTDTITAEQSFQAMKACAEADGSFSLTEE